MDGRKDLLMAWLEEEGERHCRSILLIPNANDVDPRGWVQVGVCVVGGALVAGLLACWLVTEWNQANRVSSQEHLSEVAIRMKAEHPEWEALAFGDPEMRTWFEEKLRERAGTVRRNGGDFGGLLCFRVFAVVFGTVIGALFLRAGCLLYNKMAGQESTNRVPELLLGKAMVITFAAALVNAIPGFGFLSAAAGLLVMAAMISALLPTTIVRGILVSLCYLLVGIVVSFVLAVLIGGLVLARAALR